MSVPIYQFCRGFDNVRYSEVYRCYVSGGYAFEKIARWNQEVPLEIREAVINDYFKLNDNYPPEKDDFALIAREIDDKYSVLAVANRQLDDGGRPTIGYKYFWLEKSSSDVDGIGTLIDWYGNQDQPEFKMAELDKQRSPLPEISHFHKLFGKPTFEEDQLQDIKRIVQEENKIPYTVVVTKELWKKRLPEYTKLHYLALGLSFRSNNLNAWAWNVHKLAYPERFLAIYYANKEDIPKNIRKRQLPSQKKDNLITAMAQSSTQSVPVQKTQVDKSKDDESGDKPKIKPIPYKSTPYNPTPYNPTPYNPTPNEDNTQIYISCMVFLVVSIIFKGLESIISLPKIFLLLVSIIYFIISGTVIYLTIDDFFRRRDCLSNRIIGSSLAIIYICIFVAIILQINIIPVRKGNPPQLATQHTQKSNGKNNFTDTSSKNISTTPAQINTSNGCSTDVLSNLQVFKNCNETDSDQLELELRNSYKLLTIENAKLLRQYYLDSTEKKPFQDRKSKIQECYINNSSHQSFNTCLKDIMRKYK